MSRDYKAERDAQLPRIDKATAQELVYEMKFSQYMQGLAKEDPALQKALDGVKSFSTAFPNAKKALEEIESNPDVLKKSAQYQQKAKALYTFLDTNKKLKPQIDAAHMKASEKKDATYDEQMKALEAALPKEIAKEYVGVLKDFTMQGKLLGIAVINATQEQNIKEIEREEEIRLFTGDKKEHKAAKAFSSYHKDIINATRARIEYRAIFDYAMEQSKDKALEPKKQEEKPMLAPLATPVLAPVIQHSH